MKKELCVAATAAAIVSVAPYLVQAEQAMPNGADPSVIQAQDADKQATEEQAKLEEAKKQAIAEISQLKELPNSVRNGYLTKVNDATTMEEVERVKREASQDVATRRRFEAKKADAKESLTTKEYLYPDERSNYLARLEQVGTEAEIDGILAEANQLAAANKNIFQKRGDIRDEIDILAYLSQEQKGEFKVRLEELRSEKELDNELLLAKKANIQALKDMEKEPLKKAKEVLKALKQLPEVTDRSLYDGQIDVWDAVGDYVDAYLEPFDKLNPETDTNLTNHQLHYRQGRLYDALHYGEMEYIARDLEQKRQQFPDNQELKDLVKEMFHASYASFDTAGKDGDFVKFINREIYPRQQKFNELYRILSGTPLIPLVPAQPIPKEEAPSQPEKPEVLTRQEVREEALPFQTITKENPGLLKGEKRIVTKGEAGIRTIVEEVQIQGDALLSRRVVSDMVTKPAIDEVVEIGTKEIAEQSDMEIPDGSSSEQSGQEPVLLKQHQDKNQARKVLPKTNVAPSLLSTIGIALAGLVGLRIQKRKK
ncbi:MULTISPECIES: G5 domain-containing protein [unclassified Streptococcus]|uniref:G5 domain-containing protein n=1 Tax=unclassified Streptococcus TaxID=2608887 RepID=UPI001431DEAB|nr:MULTISPECIES: G5 domain-containing protein [unclassified Streptococcus]MBF0786563.1 GA module-containing protein [Streptococcus sp. 19428wC2_LYSM12]MCQ9210944.1 G5 domain-containing protein [Streptococcus sp. B01]MCQ9214213.1 G5 domain-containing protein [Streptococcus sp. O1]